MDLPPVPAWRIALRDAAIDPTAKAVGWCLSTFMDGGGRAAVSRLTIATGCGLDSVDTVRLAIRRLERAGLLAVDRGVGRGYVSRYQLRNGEWPYALTPLKGESGDALSGEKGYVRHDKKANGDSPVLRRSEDIRAGADARARAETRGEGYGDPAAAERARAAARDARKRILGGE